MLTYIFTYLLLAANCPFKYKRNPYSQTCVQFIKLERQWEDAKTYCKSHGEHMITFTDLNAIYWFLNERKTDPGENVTPLVSNSKYFILCQKKIVIIFATYFKKYNSIASVVYRVASDKSSSTYMFEKKLLKVPFGFSQQ